MTTGAKVTKSQERAIHAFEVEVENMWLKLTKLRPGKRAEVWLTQNWLLSLRFHPMSVRVGGSPYTREITLQWFRDDAFDALESGRRGR